MVSTKIKIQLTKVMIISLVCTLFAFFLSGLEFLILDGIHNGKYVFRSAFIANIVGGFIGGAVFGSLEFFVFIDKFKKASFRKMILIKDSIYLSIFVLIVLLASLFYQLDFTGLTIFHGEVWAKVFGYLGTRGALYTFISWGSVLFTVLFMIQINERIGFGNLYDVFMGKYHKPQNEYRIFMFLDLSGSTSIAESLGSSRYYEFLNDFFADVANPVIYSEGEIYQYVGDEVTVTWEIKNGRYNSNCIRCFYDIKKTVENRSGYYRSKYGIAPIFKAGIHCGTVTVGEIGAIKKDIVFSGDVLNTAARLRSQCINYKKEFLVSQKILSMIYLDDSYEVEYIGQSELKGKLEQIGIYSLKEV